MVKVSLHRNILATNCVTCRIKIIFSCFQGEVHTLSCLKNMKKTTPVLQATNRAKSSPHALSTVMFIRSVFAIYRCYIQFQLTLVTALYYFHEIIKMTPQVMLPNLKMTPHQNSRSRPPSRVINDQPIETFGKFAWFVKLIIFLSTSPSDPPFQYIYSSQWTAVIYQLSWQNPKVLFQSYTDAPCNQSLFLSSCWSRRRKGGWSAWMV